MLSLKQLGSPVRVVPALLGFAAFLLFTPSLAAQHTRLEGVVRSETGMPLAGVSVSDSSATLPESSTDEAGHFRIFVNPDRRYVLRFSLPGYVDQQVRVDPIERGGTSRITVTMPQLYALDAVTVTTRRARPLLSTSGAATGGSIDSGELELLPTDSRDPLTLAFTIPGVTQATGFFGDAPPLSIAGANPMFTAYTVDGLENNEGFLGGPRVEIPLAAIDRLTVRTSSYGASSGRSPTGVAEIETRAGGAEWRGELFTYWRPGVPLDAAPKYAPEGVDPDGFKRVQLGAAAGGPIAAGRSFLFATVEYSNEREDRIGSTARADFLGTELRETWKMFSRLDHGWSPNQTTTVRFAMSDATRAGQGGGVIVPEADITTVRAGTSTSITHRSAIRQGRANNEISYQLGTFRWDFPPTESDLATPQVTVVSPDLTTVEAVVGSTNFVFDERELQFQLRDVFEMRIGRDHELRIGADVAHSRFKLRAASTNPRGAYTVVNEGNIEPSGRLLSIRDIPSDVRVLRYTVDAQPQQVNLTQTLWSAFIENRWRATPSLTIDLGLRWDYDDITSRGESDLDLNNFQPRAAINWYFTPEMVLRGGVGVYTGRLPYTIYSDAVQFGPNGNAVVTFEGDEFPPPGFGEGPSPEDLQGLQEEFPPREMRRMFARGLDQPNSVQATAGVQRQLGNDWVVSVDAVHVETYDLPRSWDLNAIERPLTAADTIHRSPEFGDEFRPVQPEPGGFRRLTTTDTGGRATYSALITAVRHQPTSSLSLTADWVWSRARNDTEDINFNASFGNDFDAEWADAVNDRRHQITLVGVYQSRNGLRAGLVADYQTGVPLNRVAYFRDLDGSGEIFGNGFIGNHDRFPGVPRNSERLPSRLRLDASLAWSLPLAGGALNLRAEAFNLLNSTIVSGFANGIPGGGPRTQVGRPSDPVVFNAAAPPRQIQLSARWQF